MSELEESSGKKRSKSVVDVIPIKEGFLVKKGHVRHNWKTRWFILYRDEIRYYKNRGAEEPAGIITLTGASIILSPANNKGRNNLLQVTCGKTGREFLLQTLDGESRDTWSRFIEKQIQSLQKDVHNELTVVRSSLTSRKLSLYELGSESTALDVRDIVLAMQDIQAGLELRTELIEGKTYKNVFTGASMVDWLISWSFVDNRTEGQRIGQDLIKRGYIQSIDPLTITLFRDQIIAFYRFVTLRQEPRCEPITDQTLLSLMSETVAATDVKRTDPSRSSQPRTARFFSVLSTESELNSSIPPFVRVPSPGDMYTPSKTNRSQSMDDFNSKSIESDHGEDESVFDQVSEGDIVLQGFLLKLESCHLRQTWKKRNFVLREGSTVITYYTGAKLVSKLSSKCCNNEPTGCINLGNSTVISIESQDDLRHTFQICSKKGKKYLLAATSAEERDRWVKTINNHIAMSCPYKISYSIDNTQIV
eukprot:TRINITY_DN2215_c0_g1_i1.p1 TRINITY_DN2215_c0_g1~~TRINITY_DN2215_c0_g1_i1.p1  ORF type:complete len:477 (+),score=94.61 TRINITY_DN2215_c0_g1_i1:120-1550(+)